VSFSEEQKVAAGRTFCRSLYVNSRSKNVSIVTGFLLLLVGKSEKYVEMSCLLKRLSGPPHKFGLLFCLTIIATLSDVLYLAFRHLAGNDDLSFTHRYTFRPSEIMWATSKIFVEEMKATV
jgi:hypothetical protein